MIIHMSKLYKLDIIFSTTFALVIIIGALVFTFYYYTGSGVEDYIMLWNNNGWGYNDNRNDPIADYPEWYSGTVGFICEYGD